MKWVDVRLSLGEEVEEKDLNKSYRDRERDGRDDRELRKEGGGGGGGERDGLERVVPRGQGRSDGQRGSEWDEGDVGRGRLITTTDYGRYQSTGANTSQPPDHYSSSSTYDRNDIDYKNDNNYYDNIDSHKVDRQIWNNIPKENKIDSHSVHPTRESHFTSHFNSPYPQNNHYSQKQGQGQGQAVNSNSNNSKSLNNNNNNNNNMISRHGEREGQSNGDRERERERERERDSSSKGERESQGKGHMGRDGAGDGQLPALEESCKYFIK